MHPNRIAFFVVAMVASLVTSTVAAGWFQVVDDAAADFSEFHSGLQTIEDPSAVGGSYHAIGDWGDSDDNASATVRYQLTNVPAGTHLYHISFSSPTNSLYGVTGSIAQWHVFDVAADGTENNTQNIPWAGQFGTNKQWLGTQDYKPGEFTQLGPGPQNDISQGDGAEVWINGSGASAPVIIIKFQPFYTSPIAFDAIRVTSVPAPIPGDVNFDGRVDIQDITLVANTWLSKTDFRGDTSGDGRVDIQDITLVANNWLATEGTPALIPEPSSALLASFGCVAMALWTRRRRRSFAAASV
jgi:hypothetical protein